MQGRNNYVVNYVRSFTSLKTEKTGDGTLQTKAKNKDNKAGSTFVYLNYTIQASKYLQTE